MRHYLEAGRLQRALASSSRRLGRHKAPHALRGSASNADKQGLKRKENRQERRRS